MNSNSTDAVQVMMTARQLSARWRVSVGHLANLRVRGEGPSYVKLGAAVRYRLADVEAYEAAAVVEAVA